MNNPQGTDIERIAREIAGTLRDEFPQAMDQYDQMSGRAKQRYIDMAKAALKALSEPSEGMIEAGVTFRLIEKSTGNVDTAALFTAMIQSILKEAGE